MAHDPRGRRPSLASSFLEGVDIVERDRVMASPERQRQMARLLVRLGVVAGLEVRARSADEHQAAHAASVLRELRPFLDQVPPELWPIDAEIVVEPTPRLPADSDSPPTIDV